MGGSQGPAGRAVSACGHLGCIIESIIIMSFHSILSSVHLFSSVIRTLLLSQTVKCCEKVTEHQCTHDTGFHFQFNFSDVLCRLLLCCVLQGQPGSPGLMGTMGDVGPAVSAQNLAVDSNHTFLIPSFSELRDPVISHWVD